MTFSDFSPTVPVLVRTLAERFGGREMVVRADRRVTYAEVERESAELARGLLATGIGKGSRVGLLMSNGPDWVVAWLAATRIGALLVPINTFYQTRELGWILRHADVQLLLTQHRLLSHDYMERLERCAPALAGQTGSPLRIASLPHLRAVRVWGPCDRRWADDGPNGLVEAAALTPSIDEAFLQAVEADVSPADPMLIIYSSGSAADPKGAVHTHAGPIQHGDTLNRFRDLTPADRVYSPMPFFWVGGFVYTLLSCLHAGATMLTEEVFEPGATLDFIERERATMVAGWPHYGKAMADHPSFAKRDLSSIRSGNLYELLPTEARPRDPELRSNSLGMTETCGPHTIDRMDYDLPEKLRGSFGRAVPGVEHKIVDRETGAKLPPGELGEICVRGYSVMSGLYKVPRSQVFDADGYYHTGDAGFFDAEGTLFFKGRLGEMIKTGGANVTPREVEIVLESYPEIKSAFVVGLPDPEREQLVAAAVVSRAGAQVDPDELRQRVKRDLSAYKVPRFVIPFEDGTLPLTGTGKIDKRRLVELLAETVAR